MRVTISCRSIVPGGGTMLLVSSSLCCLTGGINFRKWEVYFMCLFVLFVKSSEYCKGINNSKKYLIVPDNGHDNGSDDCAVLYNALLLTLQKCWLWLVYYALVLCTVVENNQVMPCLGPRSIGRCGRGAELARGRKGAENPVTQNVFTARRFA